MIDFVFSCHCYSTHGIAGQGFTRATWDRQARESAYTYGMQEDLRVFPRLALNTGYWRSTLAPETSAEYGPGRSCHPGPNLSQISIRFGVILEILLGLKQQNVICAPVLY